MDSLSKPFTLKSPAQDCWRLSCKIHALVPRRRRQEQWPGKRAKHWDGGWMAKESLSLANPRSCGFAGITPQSKSGNGPNLSGNGPKLSQVPWSDLGRMKDGHQYSWILVSELGQSAVQCETKPQLPPGRCEEPDPPVICKWQELAHWVDHEIYLMEYEWYFWTKIE